MTLDELIKLCRRYRVPGDAELVMWCQGGHFMGTIEPVGPVVFAQPTAGVNADARHATTVQLWPLRDADAQGAVPACPYCGSPAVAPDEPRCSSNWHTDKFVRVGLGKLTAPQRELFERLADTAADAYCPQSEFVDHHHGWRYDGTGSGHVICIFCGQRKAEP